MTTQTELEQEDLLYPDRDGKPTADNTLQSEWIMTIRGNLGGMYRDRPDVFVASDLLWYAVQGDPRACVAPDTMVVFGRPRGYRGSYRQWHEDGVAPQVTFAILSPTSTDEEVDLKLQFYNDHGVEEHYIYEPNASQLSGWLRRRGTLRNIARMHNWISPRLGIRFDLSGPDLVIYKPNGERFLTFEEQVTRDEETTQRAEEERRLREEAEQRAEQAQRHAERLKAKLRELGVDPDA